MLTPAQSSVIGSQFSRRLLSLTFRSPCQCLSHIPPGWQQEWAHPLSCSACSPLKQRPQPFTYNTNLTHRFSDETNRSGLTHADRLNHTLLNLMLSQDYGVSSQTGSPWHIVVLWYSQDPAKSPKLMNECRLALNKSGNSYHGKFTSLTQHIQRWKVDLISASLYLSLSLFSANSHATLQCFPLLLWVMTGYNSF